MSKTAEISLAVHYRDVEEDGRTHGGPMHYIEKGLGWRFLALLFSAGILINSLFSASLLQAHTVGRALLSSYDFNPYIVTGLMALVTAVVVLGGVRRIGRFSVRLVPLMSLVYILAGGAIVVLNFDQIPEVVGMIFQYAFAPAQVGILSSRGPFCRSCERRQTLGGSEYLRRRNGAPQLSRYFAAQRRFFQANVRLSEWRTGL